MHHAPPPAKTLLAIPVYNEQAYVDHVLQQVRRYLSDVLVIDDGSTDETPMLLARQPVEVIRHAVNRGYGQSLIDAFRWAQCYGFEWLITMDCDEQHEPASLPDFFEAIRADDADVISGSRYMKQSAGDDRPPPDRQKINARITAMLNERLGLRLTDAFCGFKAYRVAALGQLSLSERGYAFPMQFWVEAAAAGLRVREVPIRLIYNDPNRSFGGPLDNAEHRLKHYLSVFEEQMRQQAPRLSERAQAQGGPDSGRRASASGCGEAAPR
jgi:dolichol-phosphate mannosyltransferase